MELGEKLRQARLSAGLSQRQLCGTEITRNMLSQIESGKAHPSMATLQYLATQLDKPISFFLEEGDRSPSDVFLEKARQAFQAGSYRNCLEQLELCKEETAETVYLQYLCLLELGKAAANEEKQPYARQLLEKAGSLESIYITAPMERERQLLLLTFGGEGNVPLDDRPLLLQAAQALKEHDPAAAIRFLDACTEKNACWALLLGESSLLAGDPKTALTYLKQAEQDYPKQAIPLLEQTCKELEDYKQAYYYACLQR